MIYKRLTLFLLFIVLTVNNAAFGQTEKLIYNQLVKPNNATYYHVPVGLCEDYPEETTTLAGIRKDFEFLKSANIHLLRISFGWDAIEEEKGKFNWLFWDDFVRMAVEEYGITLVPYICYMPKWNSTGEKDTLFFWNYPPKDYNEFGVFMSQLVNRYSKWIKTWELWNEPDISIYWQGTPKDFAQMIKIGSDAVRKTDPQAKVVLGGLAHRVEFLRELFRDYGISPYVDIVNCHNYFETWSPKPIEEITNYVNEISEVIKQYGLNQSLWMAEVGYSTWRMGKSKVSNDYRAYYNYEHTPQYHAVELFKTLSLVVSTEKVAAICWYELKDLPMGENVIGDNNNRNLGVAYYDYKPKPALTALKFFNSLFSSKYKDIDSQITVIRQDNSDSMIKAFQNENGSVIVVAWLKTSFPKKRTNDTSGAMVDTRKEKVTVKIPFKLNGKITFYNEMGNELEYDIVKKEGKETMIKDLAMSGGKIYIIKMEK
ncbi:MAG: hypothetical protein Q8940_16075 [Bacteroidota bacterium]|nr:hypothetical protein [Bacteroidota bacterium]